MSNKTITTIEFGDKLKCPHCGVEIISLPDVTKCTHLVFAFGWNEQSMFLAIHPDYAKSFIDAMINSTEYPEHLENNQIRPLSIEEQKEFCKGDFTLTYDDISATVAEYCWGLPEEMFPELLSKNTTIYISDGYYSGIHVGIRKEDQR